MLVIEKENRFHGFWHDIRSRLGAELTETPPPKTDLFTFDLTAEAARFQKYGKAYLPHFLANAHFYAKETYFKVPLDLYEQIILEPRAGVVELGFDNGQSVERSEDGYRRYLESPDLPHWCRLRGERDLVWLHSIQQQLVDAKVGQIFVDLSPTAYDVSMTDRQKHNFKAHSMARLHQLVQRGDQKVLASTTLRNYLAMEEQLALFGLLTGQQPAAADILGRVAPLKEDIGAGTVQKIVQDLYDQTPLERKIPIPKEDREPIELTQAKQHLKTLEPLLTAIGWMMLKGGLEAEVTNQFHDWEKAVKRLAHGKGLDGYKDDVYAPETNDCPGEGSGFRKTGRLITLTSNNENCDRIRCKRVGGCPGNWIASDSEVQLIKQGKLTSCPICGWRP